MQTIPAAPGTYVIERERGKTGHTKIPIIGYAFIQEGPAFPIAVINYGGLTRGRALVTPDGLVTDPSFGIVCADTREWMHISDGDGYWTKAEKAPPKRVDDDTHSAGLAMDAALKTTGGERVNRIPDKPKGKPQVFQTTSFWKDEMQQALFVVEPEIEAPAKNDARYEKIKRDEWQALKKGGMKVVPWPPVEENDAMELV